MNTAFVSIDGLTAATRVLAVLAFVAALIALPLPAAADTPTVTGISITSDPGTDGYYKADDVITIQVSFSKAVNITGGSGNCVNLAYKLDSRTSNKSASVCETITNVTSHTFRVTVSDGDSDTDGISIPANPLSLSGDATIKDADGDDASLAHGGLAAQSGHKVDGVKPGIGFATVEPAAYTNYPIILTDSGSKVAKYAVIKVPGAATDATGCDDPSGDGFSRKLVSVAAPSYYAFSPTASSYYAPSWLYDADGGKKLCVYVADAAGNQASSLNATPILPSSAAKPTGLVATAGDKLVRLTWKSPNDRGIIKYQYQQKTSGEFDDSTWTDFPSDGTTIVHTITGLNNDTAYTFRLRAVGRRGNGPPSGEVTATPASSTSPGPLLALSAGGGYKRVKLQWIKPSLYGVTGIAKYQVRYKAGEGNYNEWKDIRVWFGTRDRPILRDWAVHSTMFTSVGGLVNGTSHTFQMRAVTSDGNLVSDEVTATPTPRPPRKLTATPSAANTIFLVWQEPAVYLVSLSGYILQVSTDAGKTWSPLTSNSFFETIGSTDYTHTGLVAGTTYHYRVKARYNRNRPDTADSVWSDIVSVKAVGRMAPALKSARVNGAELELRFGAALDESSAPPASAFAVSVAGSARNVSTVSVSQDTVTLTLAQAVTAGETVTVGYTPPSSGKLRREGGGDVAVAAFSGQAVTNATPSTGAEQQQSPPEAAEAPATALTARFSRAPAEHDGGAFAVRIRFSEDVGTKAKDAAVGISGGSMVKARRVNGRRDLWQVEVLPAGHGAVTVTLPATADCAAAGAVCTAAGQKLENPLSVTVKGPLTLSVADARAREGTDATVDFAVTLSRAATDAVSVRYATRDGTAKKGTDYRKTKGTLTFAAGETAKTVQVPILDDAHDEGEETFTLVLKKATGAAIADGEATGTIENSDPLQQAWLARFGRTAATHVTDAVGERLRGAPGQGSYLTIGGSRLPLGQREESDQPSMLEAVAGVLGLGGTGGAGTPATDFSPMNRSDPRLGQSRTLNGGDRFRLREILLGSSFHLNLNAANAGASLPRLTAWGRFAGTTFDGQDGTLSLDGDVFTGTVGVDGTWDRLLAGVAVAHSRGDGSFSKPGTEDRGRGDLEQTLTSIYPYLRYAVTDRLDVWGLVGYGWGELDLEMANGETLETDTNLLMGAFGGRGVLLTPAEAGGFQLATRTDAMLTRTSADAVAGMASSDGDAHRLRLILEGSRGVTWTDGRSLTPTVELGLRHDWGDAETGFGLEVGGRVRYADPRLGLTIEGAVRGLVAHEDEDYNEWGASGTVRLDPGASGQGLAVTLAPTWGAASSGVEGLWSRQTTAGLAPQDTRRAPAGRLAADVGYGVPLFDTGLLTPYAGTVLADGAARTYRLGTRLQMTGRGTAGLTLNLEGTRQEPMGQPVNQGVQVQATWGF